MTAISLALIFVVVLYTLWTRARGRSETKALPPGPKKLLIIGNLLEIPSTRPWVMFAKWARDYGSGVIHISAPGTSIIVLSSLEAMRDLLEKRGSRYSDRGPMPMMKDLIGWDFSFDDEWRRQRKLLHRDFSLASVQKLRPQLRDAARELIRDLSNDPQAEVMSLMGLFTARTIIRTLYGLEVPHLNHAYIKNAVDAIQAASAAAVPGAFLVVSHFPIESKLENNNSVIEGYLPDPAVRSWVVPRRGISEESKALEEVDRSFAGSSFPGSRTPGVRQQNNTAQPCFVQRQLADCKTAEQIQSLKAAAASMYATGADTTISPLGTFVLAMMEHPDIQRHAQDQIDRVVGRGRLPDFEDRARLPYVDAILKELFRWRPSGPIGIPHYISVDDEYRGYHIPAGSKVIANVWGLLQNEDLFPDPHDFRPERFLVNGVLREDIVVDPAAIIFGFGRRSSETRTDLGRPADCQSLPHRLCPGQAFALDSLWITIATLLAAMHIEKPRDESGNIVEPSHEYFYGVNSVAVQVKHHAQVFTE
ncbi:unnamed protein product [Mycena citricolor]|uniref:Cytochrome P450 n=1 Tax=Mycena citricolor TaxID=2018698 RepID=A0AAD2HVY2_9AGAR|nr:unnamed protein product [Mycena citricolor]